MSQQQLIAYKRAYYDRGIEIENLNAKIAELEAKIKELETPVEPKKTPAKKGDK